MTDLTPVALESAANQAYGKALHDVARAADALRRDLGSSSWTTIATLAGLCAALDRLKALGWPSGPERVGTAPGSLTGPGDGG